VSLAKDLVILAVTKMHGGVCYCGHRCRGNLDPPHSATIQTHRRPQYDFRLLLAADRFFQGGKAHLVNAGVSRVWLSTHVPARPHIEIGRSIFAISLNCVESSASRSRLNFSLATVNPIFPRLSPMKFVPWDYAFQSRSASALP